MREDAEGRVGLRGRPTRAGDARESDDPGAASTCFLRRVRDEGSRWAGVGGLLGHALAQLLRGVRNFAGGVVGPGAVRERVRMDRAPMARTVPDAFIGNPTLTLG